MGRCLLFDNIRRLSEGFRIAANVLASARALRSRSRPANRCAEVGNSRRPGATRFAIYKPFAPVEVSSGPMTENILEGDARRFGNIFPTPKWHEHDGGRYIGTGDMVDDQRSRQQLDQRRYLPLLRRRQGPRHALDHRAKTRQTDRAQILERGSAPVPSPSSSVARPATWMAAPSAAKAGVSEYEYAGALRGTPLEVILSLPLTGLPVPATSEIVIEGEMPLAGRRVARGRARSAKWPGYYTHSGDRMRRPRQADLYHRNDPILLGNPPLLPITERYGIPLYAARIWDHLEQLRHLRCARRLVPLPHFDGRRFPEATARRPRHYKRSLPIAGMQTGASMYRYYVAVDDDIDPVDLKQVIWAMCTRVDPAESVQILKLLDHRSRPALAPGETRARAILP